ncbi:DUF559 domain-containing protein [Hyphomicrobiales bacterium BP6-180914]|uniref:DUF559 domain-containing protein n=2 Tax=Lichenifustis flavocetrariae TaxID=2949735 RepID=A0AA41YW08_9HYPH|nr:DUF559 domain-containing protein [Lichenifustis flavocetrariae]
MLRRRLTDAERKLWLRLRDRRLGGYKFLRQVPIGRYVADFACRDVKLIFEVDGSRHARGDRDAHRDAALACDGYKVLRFWNPEVLLNIEYVCETIVAALEGRLQPSDRFRSACPPHESHGRPA